MRQMQIGWRSHDARSGQMFVIAAIALVVMMVLAALVIDVGYLLCTEARLQNAADAGAVAAGLELAARRNDGATESGARSAAETEAQDIASANSEASRCEVLFGTFEDDQFTEEGVGTDAEAVQVTVCRDESAPGGPLSLFFASVVGIDSVDVSSEAVCQLAEDIRSVRNSGMIPFSVHSDEVGEPGETITLYDNTKQAPGNFGILAFGGGSMDDLWDWILNGYPGEVDIDPDAGYAEIQGTPGLRTPLDGAVQQRIGDTVIVCVHNQVDGQGSNTTFRVIGFLAVTITECQMTGEDKHIRGIVSEMFSVPFAETGGSADGNLCKVQLVQ